MKASTIYRRVARKLLERGGFVALEIQDLDAPEAEEWGPLVREFFSLFGSMHLRHGFICVDPLIAEIDEQVNMLCLMGAIAEDWE